MWWAEALRSEALRSRCAELGNLLLRGVFADFAELSFPNADDVGKQTQAHERGLAVLVLQKEVEEGVGTADSGGEEEGGFGVFDPGVDEGTGIEGKGVPIDKGGCGASRWWRRKAAAFSGLEKVARKSLSWGWWRDSSGMGTRARRKKPQPRQRVSRGDVRLAALFGGKDSHPRAILKDRLRALRRRIPSPGTSLLFFAAL